MITCRFRTARGRTVFEERSEREGNPVSALRHKDGSTRSLGDLVPKQGEKRG